MRFGWHREEMGLRWEAAGEGREMVSPPDTAEVKSPRLREGLGKEDKEQESIKYGLQTGVGASRAVVRSGDHCPPLVPGLGPHTERAPRKEKKGADLPAPTI